jgi:predicted SPOUT superfamily RNA methylase MTH1
MFIFSIYLISGRIHTMGWFSDATKSVSNVANQVVDVAKESVNAPIQVTTVAVQGTINVAESVGNGNFEAAGQQVLNTAENVGVETIKSHAEIARSMKGR